LGKEVNMKNKSWGFILLVLFISAIARVQAQDESEVKDTPWFSGMPNYTIYDGEEIEFDSYNFFNGKNCTTVEGRKFKRIYSLKEDAQKSSVIQVMRNYENAIKSMGGTVIYEGMPQNADCAENNGLNMVIGKVVKGADELWVEVVTLGGDDYYLTIIQKELMKQDVTASNIFEALNRDGHIALYINFDTGKAIIRDESKPVIDQIVQMMKTNPDLKIGVEGHTDNVGTPASNKTLSEARAKSVVSAIVAQGVSDDRLISSGYGQDKPIADNNTEEGRAKNRRVELVKK
jgi:outer membrane protein OmpA-like peptidoglycan-associated protein